jgi:hypothetical protein
MTHNSQHVIIHKIVKDALSVGVTTSGKYKLWHVWVASLVAAFLAGLAI